MIIIISALWKSEQFLHYYEVSDGISDNGHLFEAWHICFSGLIYMHTWAIYAKKVLLAWTFA